MLSQDELKDFYDRFGEKQDTQGFYEDIATDTLISYGHFDAAKAIFEYGLGTGRFAEELLSKKLADTCQYVGVDLSATMIELASNRLQRWKNRCDIRLSDGATTLPEKDGAFDRFISNYVFDLLGDEEISKIVDEAHRMLTPNGLLCLVSLTHGRDWRTRSVSHMWNLLYRTKPTLVGGCRPIELLNFIPRTKWSIERQTVVAAFGISSEVVVARRQA